MRRKRSKRKEIKLEAFSVSENFDPETYIIPIQNRWTIERDHGRASDISINDERNLISNDDSVRRRFCDFHVILPKSLKFNQVRSSVCSQTSMQDLDFLSLSLHMSTFVYTIVFSLQEECSKARNACTHS